MNVHYIPPPALQSVPCELYDKDGKGKKEGGAGGGAGGSNNLPHRCFHQLLTRTWSWYLSYGRQGNRSLSLLLPACLLRVDNPWEYRLGSGSLFGFKPNPTQTQPSPTQGAASTFYGLALPPFCILHPHILRFVLQGYLHIYSTGYILTYLRKVATGGGQFPAVKDHPTPNDIPTYQ